MDPCGHSEELRLLRVLEELREMLAGWHDSCAETNEATFREQDTIYAPVRWEP
jgi:hypothetical protein